MDGIQSEHIHSSFEDILTSMKASTDNFTLTSANKLFVNKLFNLQEAFTQQTKKHYHVSAAKCVCLCVCGWVGLLRHPCAPFQWYMGALCTIWRHMHHQGAMYTVMHKGDYIFF